MNGTEQMRHLPDVEVYAGAVTGMPAVPLGRVARFELKAVPEAASRARGLVEAMFISWACRHLIPDGQLIASELISNTTAVTPGEVVWLLLAHGRDAAWIGVWDSSPVPPQKRLRGPYSESGRGLHIVAAIADEDGAFPVAEPRGKIAWARLKI
ncbi:MAG: ATP-binding protein [Actinomadura sp.]